MKAGRGGRAGPTGSTEHGASPSRRNFAAALGGLLRPPARFLLASFCHACREPLEEFFSGGVCAACWRELPQNAGARCRVCDDPLPAAALAECGRCLLDPPAFDSLRAAAPYRGVARRVLLALKFRGADVLAPHLAKLLVARLLPAPDVDLVVAVPSWKRLGLLGAPHAADLLAAAVARRLGLPLSRRLLRKTRRTRRQSGLPLARRLENVRGAFRAHCPAPARILLVDDVATSGATARACAAALKKAGAREIHVWCFARASRDADPAADR
jgi:predicted amidophosphoribosyltransferase